MKQEQNGVKAAFSGAISGFAARFITAPLDIVKIRLQLQTKNNHYRGLFSTLRAIVKEEGILAIYKGNLTGDLLYISFGAVQFSIYNEWRRHHDSNMTTATGLQGGAISSFFASVITYPLDILRTRLSSQGEPKLYNSLTDGARYMYKHNGVRGFYAGLGSTLMQIMPSLSLQFALYESALNALRKNEEDKSTTLEIAISSAAAGAISKMIILPLDVVKKRMQVQGFNGNKWLGNEVHGSFRSCIVSIVKNEGVYGLYKGGVPSIIKALVASTTIFLTYETIAG